MIEMKGTVQHPYLDGLDKAHSSKTIRECGLIERTWHYTI